MRANSDIDNSFGSIVMGHGRPSGNIYINNANNGGNDNNNNGRDNGNNGANDGDVNNNNGRGNSNNNSGQSSGNGSSNNGRNNGSIIRYVRLEDNVIYSKNITIQNAIQLALIQKWANPAHDLPTERRITATNNGIFTESFQPRRYDIHQNTWEGFKSLSIRHGILNFLTTNGWDLHSALDVHSTAVTTKVPAAPICFDNWFQLGLFRILFKMIDDRPETLQDKYYALVAALQVIYWPIKKKAMGKSESKTQAILLESLVGVKDIFMLRDRLAASDAQRVNLGSSNFNTYRYDRQAPKAYNNDRGCIAPTRYSALSKDKEREEINKLKNWNKSNSSGNNNSHVGAYSGSNYRRNNNNNNNNNGPRGGRNYNNNNNNSSNYQRPREGSNKGYKSSFSNATGLSPAPLMDRFFNARYHQPKTDGYPESLCRNWQSDNCIIPNGGKCSKFHKCRHCGGRHPGDFCRNKR